MWCVFLPLFLLLLFYQLTVAFYPLTEAQEDVFQFLAGKGELNQDYTAAEISHLQDVAGVMNGVNIFGYVIGTIIVLSLICFLIYFRKDKTLLSKLLRYGGMATLATIGIILLSILFAFNSSFTAFHQLFFPQGNWQFAADSLLILTFPLEFFIKISFLIFGIAFISGSLFILLSVYIKYDPTNKRN